MSKRCMDYVGVACVNGNCPKAYYDFFISEGMFDIAESFAGIKCCNCPYYLGCDDCYFAGTDYCDYQEGLKQDGNDKL